MELNWADHLYRDGTKISIAKGMQCMYYLHSTDNTLTKLEKLISGSAYTDGTTLVEIPMKKVHTLKQGKTSCQKEYDLMCAIDITHILETME